MLTSLLDTIGDWNPQLLRELKGHLKPLKIGVAIALALITQIVFLIIVWGQLPGEIAPGSLEVTTYPQIQMNYGNTGPLSVHRLQYSYPLAKHPNYDIGTNGLEPYSHLVKEGDRILAINGQPLSWDETGENNPLGKQDLVERSLEQPFVEEIQQLRLLPPVAEQAARTLRQQVPGTMVDLTLARDGWSDPIEVSIPRIVVSIRTNSYCLPLENWQTQVQGGDRLRRACSAAVGSQQYTIDWFQWHRNAFWGLSITLLFPMLILGTYVLINNLLKEERDGTLNFIRLSPQSAREILLGKMMGVPALIYLAVAVTLPLHLLHGLSAGLGGWVLIGFYGATVAIAFLTFSMALLLGMVNMSLGMVQAWLGAGAVFLIQLLCLQASRYAHVNDGSAVSWALMFTPFSVLRDVGGPPFVDGYWGEDALFQWFGIPMISVVVILLLLANAALLSRWVWHALERRFFNSTSTLLSKAQSYGLTLVVNLAAVGFSWHAWAPISEEKVDPTYAPYSPPSYWIEQHLLFLLLLNLGLWVAMIVALSPQRQSLHDWARYRHVLPASTAQPGQPSWNKFPRRSFWSDLIWGEKSPIVVAIALNLLIGAGCIFLWTLYQVFLSVGDWSMFAMSIIVALQHSDGFSLLALAFIVLLGTTNILLICTTIAQLIFLKREKHALPTALLVLLVLLLGIPITLGLTSTQPGAYPAVWFVLFPWVSVFEPFTFVGAGILGLFGQWMILGLLNGWLFRWLDKIGTSESKDVLTGTKGLLPE
ncbi:MAG: ABC transporter permease subunit [Leptolyngbyaceae cyanobacterium]